MNFKTTSFLRAFGITLCAILTLIVSTYFSDSPSQKDDASPLVETESRYADFLINHPFREAMNMPKVERKANALPPNAYFEQEYLYTSNPELLRPTREKLFELQEEIARNSTMRAAPGDATNAWVERGPNNVGGRTRALMFAPGSTTTVFAGGVSGGLWKNNNITSAASQWQRVTGVPGNLSVTCMTVDPNDSNIMYLGTGEVYTGDVTGNGIYQSTDGGDTWVSVFTGGNNVNTMIAYVQDIIAIDNNGTTEVFFGAGATAYGQEVTGGAGGFTFPGFQSIGLYKSVNGGAFSLQGDAVLQTGGSPYSPNNFDVGADGTLWMGTRPNVFNAGGGHIFSYDGNTWTNVRDLGTDGRIEVAASKQTAGKIYLLAQDRTDGANPVKIFRTTNAFTTAPASLPQPNDVDNDIPASDFTRNQSFYDLLLGVDPLEDDIVYVGGIDLFKSTNSGNAWTQISKWSNNNNLAALNVPLIHADQHGIAFATEAGATTGRILFGNDGGVAYTSNGGGNNAHRNNGYNVTQFYKADINQNIAIDKLIAGAQDNGVQFLDGTPESPSPSVEIAGGDGCWVFIDEQSQFMLSSFVFNSYSYHNMTGANFGNIPAPLDPAGNGTTDRLGNAGDFVNQCGLDSESNILYTNGTWQGNFQIFRYAIDPSGPTVTSDIIDNALINHVPTFFVASPFTANRILVGTAIGRIVQIDDANATPIWSNLGNPGGVSGAVSDIRYGETENDILVTYHNYGVNSIWYTSDGGINWVSKEGNLPDIPVKAILQNPSNREEVIVGTELGVWKTNDWSSTNPTWLQSQNGMSDVKVTSLELRTADNTIVASTYGRGMFTGTFDGDLPSVCDSNGTTVSNVGITNVTLGAINNSDGPNKDVGYEDFTAISTSAVLGDTNDLSVSINTDGNNTVEVRVWVDWNNDLDFDDVGEEFDLGSATNVGDDLTDASPFSLTIPATTFPGNKKMRVSAKNGSAPTACEIDFDGEVEDYTLIVIDYCESTSTDVNFEYISDVTLNGQSNPSTNSEGGYSDFTGLMPVNLERGSSPSISVSKFWPTANQYNESVTVWIDYNKDGVFNNNEEKVFQTPADQNTPVMGNFNTAVPVDAKLGNTRMRVAMKDTNADTDQNDSCDLFTYGEVEDYTVNITAAAACSQIRTFNGSWVGGAPTSSEKAVFASSYNTTTASIDACEIEIEAGVTVTVSAATYLKAEGNIIVNGTLIVEHEGSVVQVDDAATVTKGAGATIEVRKTTLSMKPRDFMFAGTPMTGETRDGVYGNVLDAATATNDQAFRVIYLNPELFQEDPAVANHLPYMGAETFLSIDNTFLGNHTAAEPIVPGEGLVIYPQHSFSADGITTTYDFTYDKGTLNNGVITYPINYNGATEDNFNLLSNPYASAIDIVELMDINPMITEVYFWEHATTPNASVPGYLGENPDMMDFSMRNLTTGMAAPNKPASTPTQYIASGQGFAIKALQAASGTTQVTFNNAMRVTGNNDQYRNIENRELLWLKISNPSYELSSTAAVGFLSQATKGLDLGYDSKRMATPISIYTSLKSGEQLGIQGRETFDTDIIVPVGIATAIEEAVSYTISLDSYEGTVLSETPIYLVDLLEGTYVNLKEKTYTFNTGIINSSDRFILTFRAPEALGVAEEDSFENTVQLFPNPARDVVTIAFNGQEQLRNARIIDANGKLVKEVDLSDFNIQQSLNISDLATGIYFVEISGSSSTTVKKLIKK